ncbi:MAG: hypothetical protein HAW63_02435 [Bdellovibrionaceae bacterium]|nr:hypothetical protein [Pseudobdellovibrionaceae bacterium]
MTLSSNENIQISPAYLDSESLTFLAKKIHKKIQLFYPNSQLLIQFHKQGNHNVECLLQLTETDFFSSHKAPSFQQALHYCGRRLVTQIKKQNKKHIDYKKAA